MDVQYKTKRIMLKEIEAALTNEEMEILYQPTVELNTARVMGAEGVMNFSHSQYGICNAEKLYPLIEGTSLVKNLSIFMFKTAIKQLASWHQANHKIYMVINLLNATDPDMPDTIANLLAENNISAEYLKVELTERACLSDQKRTIVVLNKLATLGVKLTFRTTK